ncbi:MAG TPA: Ig-like domain-containing protein [Gemmatimonadales bacterium]|nr:Ig-like domain-containing protein [Gemmatimonadales bacterium]
MGPPPGGPPDKVPPVVLSTVPESLGVYPGWNQDVELVFDKIVSEGSSPNYGLGTGDLEKLIILSPGIQVPVIRWKRDRITVRPRDGWRSNTVYRVQLLPGIQGLHRNRSDSTYVLTFSTGGELPHDTLHGILIDWVQDKVAIGGLVELVHQPDSLVYRTVADSGGRFTIGPLPNGPWIVYGVIDQNRNLRRETRESYDSAEVGDTATVVRPLWLIPRDTVGPRISSITPTDSMSATVTFSGPLDPYQHFDSLAVRFMLQQDSTPVPYRSLLPKDVDDSLQKLLEARLDSIRRATDTTHHDTTGAKFRPVPTAPVSPPVVVRGRRGGREQPKRVDAVADSIIKSRPALFDHLILRTDSVLQPETHYLLFIDGIRSAAGVPGIAKGSLVVPKPKPPKPLKADSTARADSLAGQKDSSSAASPAPAPAPPAPAPQKPSP